MCLMLRKYTSTLDLDRVIQDVVRNATTPITPHNHSLNQGSSGNRGGTGDQFSTINTVRNSEVRWTLCYSKN